MSKNIYNLYNAFNFSLSSCDIEITFEDNKIKKHLNFYGFTNWKENPKLNEKASCQLLVCGKKSNITAIDIDDLTNEKCIELMELCDKHCNFIQRTRKGYHYIFEYTDKLKTTVGKKAPIDIRNDDSILIVEPTQYEYNGEIYKYEIIKKPLKDQNINPITDEILNKFFEINGIDNNDKKTIDKIKDTNKQTNKDLKNCTYNKTITEEDLKFILDNINIDRFDNFSDWVILGIILKKLNFSYEIFEEYSKKSIKYVENEPYNKFMSFNVELYEVGVGTLYYWLKIDNKDKFNELMNKGKDDYQKGKEEIEKKYFLVGSKFYKKLENREGFDILREADIKIELKPRQIEIYNPEKNKNMKVDIYSKWIIDANRSFFDRTDFIPNTEDCPKNVYNLFDGFEVEKYLNLVEDYTTEQIDLKITPFIDHINFLTNGQPDYFINWLSHIIQKPNVKEGTTPLFRDKGNFLQCGGGTGKNLFFDNFGNKILGAKYYLTVGTNQDLYNSFNEHLENKLLVCVEEAQGKSNFENFDRLKSIITQSKTTINRKGIPKYTINDYSRYIFCSNNENPIPIDNNDRRFFTFDVNSNKRGDSDYFKKLDNAFNDKEAIAAFFTYLKNYEVYTSPIDYQNNRPMNKSYIEIKRINAPIIIKWLISIVKKDNNDRKKQKYNNRYDNITLSELYADFFIWIEETRNKKSDISLNAFSRFLTSDSDIFTQKEIEKTKSSSMKIKLNIKSIKLKLIDKNYIDENLDDCNFID